MRGSFYPSFGDSRCKGLFVEPYYQPEPAAQYQELLNAYSAASRAFRAAETDLQRKRAAEQLDDFPQ